VFHFDSPKGTILERSYHNKKARNVPMEMKSLLLSSGANLPYISAETCQNHTDYKSSVEDVESTISVVL
jgi:hypothetical protein